MAESTRGYADPEVDDSNWRDKTRARATIKFCDKLKQIYLDEIKKHGKRGIAALHAGVAPRTVSDHMKQDPEFREAFDTAYDEYRQERARKLELQAMRGFKETIFSPTGERSTRRRYETQLRVMVLKAMEPELYTEKQQVDITLRGGPMVVPAILNPEEWAAQFAEYQKSMELPESTNEPAEPSGVMEAEFQSVR